LELPRADTIICAKAQLETPTGLTPLSAPKPNSNLPGSRHHYLRHGYALSPNGPVWQGSSSTENNFDSLLLRRSNFYGEAEVFLKNIWQNSFFAY
jgi:hypothetical protein